jgi:hypothetical protein
VSICRSVARVIKGGGRRVVYLGSAGVEQHAVAAEMHRTPLRHADALILPSLKPTPTAEEAQPLTRVAEAVKRAVRANGSVLVPGATAMKKLRIVRLGFGTARQKRVLE